MKRLRLTGPPEFYEPRLDDFDLHSIGIEASNDFGRHVSELVRSADDGPVAVHGFTVERINDTDLRVHRGAAVVGLVDEGATRFGQLASEGAASRVVSLSTQPHGTLGIYVWFAYVWGDPAQMAYAKPGGTEGVRQQNTRDVPEWFAIASVGAPADPAISGIAYKVADVTWDGTLTDGYLHDTRGLLFEGQGSGGANPATVWTIPDFDRGASRATVGVRSLSQWVMAAAKRFEELSGRAWYAKPVYGENVRSASADILVSPSAGQEKAVHLVLSADTAERVNLLTTRIEQPGAGGDPRTTLRFVPSSGGNRPTINLDTTAFPVQAVSPANARRTVAGSASLTRTAGNNPVLRTVGFEGELRDLHFGGSVGNACLVQGASVSDDVTFIGCTFAADSLTQPAVRITAGGTYRFIGCTFTAASGQSCLTIEAAARVTVEGCDFTTGAEGIDASVAPAILEVSSSRFSSTRGINLDAAGGLIALDANTFTGTSAWRRRLTVSEVVERLVAGGPADYRGAQLAASTLRAVSPAAAVTTDVPVEVGGVRHPLYFGRLPDDDSPFIGADLNVGTGRVESFDLMQARTGNTAIYADARARRLHLAGDGVLDPAVVFDPARNQSGLRLARAPGSATELRVLDGAGTSPVAGVIGAKRIRLGGRLYGNSMLPRVVGTIEWQKAWEAGAEKQDRRTNAGVGFFESAIRLGEGGDGGITVTALDAAGDPWAAGLIANHHFRVAGLAMGTTDYVVVAHLTTNVDVSKLGGLTSIKKVEVVVCNQTSDGFDLVPVLGTEGWPCNSNPNASVFNAENGDGYQLVFQVCRLVD